MEYQTLLEQRRSIRNYAPEGKPGKEDLEQILNAAIAAPSWKNSQTARFYCALSDEMTEKVRSCMPPFNAERSQNAALIVTVFEKNISGYNTAENVPENEGGNGWGCYDLGLSSGNILLKATELGYGSLVMGIRDGEKLRKVFDIPESQQIMSVIAIGKSAESPEKRPRKSIGDVAVIK